jgi:hypothetical protein
MSDGIESYIRGAFHGYRRGAIFKLANGQTWQQNDNLYQYQYAYQPEAHVYAEGGRQMILVAGMDGPVEVTGARIIAEGQIVSDFKGFDQDMQFEFSNGQIWEQAEYKYNSIMPTDRTPSSFGDGTEKNSRSMV